MFTGSKSKFKLLNVNLNILNYDDTSLELVRSANDLNVYVNCNIPQGRYVRRLSAKFSKLYDSLVRIRVYHGITQCCRGPGKNT